MHLDDMRGCNTRATFRPNSVLQALLARCPISRVSSLTKQERTVTIRDLMTTCSISGCRALQLEPGNPVTGAFTSSTRASAFCVYAATISWLIPVPLSRSSLESYSFYLISSHVGSSHLVSSHFIQSHFISLHLIQSILFSSHISSHPISFHLISSHVLFSHFFRIISSHILSRRLSSSQPTPALLSWSQWFSALLMSSQLTSPCLTHLILSHWGSSPGACVRFLQFFFFCCLISLLWGFFAGRLLCLGATLVQPLQYDLQVAGCRSQ